MRTQSCSSPNTDTESIPSAPMLCATVKDYRAIANEVSAQLAAHGVEQDAKAGSPVEEVSALKQSGLLLLPIPREYGGVGATWPQIYNVVQILSKAQGSMGQLYANHATLVSMGRLVDGLGQAEQYYRLTAQQNLFWANALNSRDQRLKLMSVNGAFRLNGVKSFCTGMVAADISIVLSMQEKSNHPVLCVVPMDREGITYNHDWDTMGQRRTASGSYTFHDVLVKPDEILGPPLANGASTTLKSLIALLGQTFVYLGIAEGALEAAKGYTINSARAWIASDVETATQDPFILQRYGQMWAELQAAIALTHQASEALQAGWGKDTALTAEERGEIAISVASARAIAIQAGLKITNTMFDVMGARATAANYGFDRYWRDLRTFSLHDPIDYKFKDIGNWMLNQQYPTPSQYS